MRLTKQCHGCKQQFRYSELVDYTGLGATKAYSYCPKCLAEKQSRERFQNKVCAIFGIKAPGPRIWTERKRLINTYGYTDDILIDCLDYLYNVAHVKKLTESLCLITPKSVDAMLKWKREQKLTGINLAQAMENQPKETMVELKDDNDNNTFDWNPDDWLF